MKTITLLAAYLVTGFFATAQTTTAIDTSAAATNLKTAAQKMGQFFVDKNYTAYVKYMHPKITQMAGGNTKLINIIKGSIKQMEDQGISFVNVTIGDASKLITTKTEMQAIIPQILEMKMATGKLVARAYLLGVSPNKGKSWYFIDTSDKTIAQLKEVIPGLSKDLVIPAKEKPVFYKN